MDIVLYESSELEPFTEPSESEDEDENDSEYSVGERAQSIISEIENSIRRLKEVLSYGRSFVHGDIVSAITDPSGQLGQVVDVNMTVELKTACCGMIKDVNSKKLLRLQSYVSGDHVIKGPWLGKVDRVFEVITVLFSDGAKCEVLVRDSNVLTPVCCIIEDMLPFTYYPGQRVRVKAISESATWLCGIDKRDRDEGTVCHVDVGLLYINWLTSLNFDSVRPSYFQDPKDLILLSCFSYENWQPGDWCTIPVDSSKHLSTTFEQVKSPNVAPKCCEEMQKEIAVNAQQMCVVTKTKIKVDIMWQNGEVTLGVDPETLSPVNSICDHEFWPDQYVLEKVASLGDDISKLRRLGIVKSADSRERTVKVIWIEPDFKKVDANGDPKNEEIVSAYELIEHPDFSFCIGAVVFRNLPGVASVQNNLHMKNYGKWQTNDSAIKNNSFYRRKDVAHELATYDKDAQSYLSFIGSVVGHDKQRIVVKWANGTLSTVSPEEIIGLDELLGAAQLQSVNAEVHPNQEKQLWDKKEKCLLQKVSTDDREDWLKDLLTAGVLLFPRAAFWLFSHFDTFESGDSTSPYSPKKDECRIWTSEGLPLAIQQQDLNQKTQKVMSVLPQQFDIASDCTDHHFLDDSGNNLVTKSWLKRVHQEWNALKRDLPDNIYIRVYEERMDLLRACIVGASGTPYHDGLFFFDIVFPPCYPYQPPAVHYISGGLRLNPNLYESGKVCLSLLNTWMGTESELWNPGNSTILQLLLSLQALVLNEKPYFNEAGYDEQIGRIKSEKNSITYNENALIQSCKSMLYIMHRPPKNFEELVKEHFSCRSHHILGACKAYMNGAQVGYPSREDQGQGHCSTGFKIALAKLFPKLVDAFTKIGADCSLYLDQVNN